MNTKFIKESALCSWDKHNKLSKLINIFTNKVEIRFVGGCIRDVLLNFELKDIDFAIDCKPEDTVRILSENKIEYQDYGLSHGTVTALIDGTKYEITSLRKDVKTDGRFAQVEYTNNWEDDVLRRDFSMNAIYVSVSGDIYDSVNGIQDIQNQQISFIGEVTKRIQEDYLRILRFYRFLGIFRTPKYNQEDFKIISNNFGKIRNFVSKNKVRKEIFKMLQTPFSINSFLARADQNRNIIESLEKWWIEDKYKIGLEILDTCKKIINDKKY